MQRGDYEIRREIGETRRLRWFGQMKIQLFLLPWKLGSQRKMENVMAKMREKGNSTENTREGMKETRDNIRKREK